MSTQLRLKCPGCQATLQVKSEMRGREISCPKCQKRLRLPAAPASAPSPNAPSAQAPSVNAPSVKAQAVVPARPIVPAKPAAAPPTEPSLWDDPSVFGAAASQADPFSQPGNANSYAPAYGAYSAPTKSSSAKSRSSRKNEPLSESDSSTQSTGIFLVVVPILAAILPLFGLQLRRLASAGEYAPLGAMMLGFIGAGMIYYARRLRSDAVIVSMAAAVVTIVFGVGGFLIQRNAAEQGSPVAAQGGAGSVPAQGGAGGVPATKLTPEQRAMHERNIKEIEAKHRQFTQEVEKNSQALRNQLGSSPDEPDSVPNNAPLPGAFGSPAAAAPAPSMTRPPINNFNADGADLAQEPRVQHELFRISGQGKSEFFRLGFGNQSRVRTHALVGSTSQQASLFAQAPVVGICGFTLGPSLNLVPLSTKIDGVKYAIQPGPQEELVGIRLAFEGSAIVGYQGLIRSKTTMQVTDTDWFGRQTSDIRESINPSPGQYGMICYSDGPDCCGFAWVER